ncbi:MAG TPA: hypothetical protein VJP81_08245 [Candidatus Dormibacteraeota bacterium]|nr:hypothetical protein [Candidatus Dormibacteraeota bacterium]
MKITARRPEDVAGEVELCVREGCRVFAVARIDHGGMLDRERLGAARYAAGLQSTVELEAETPAEAAAVR